MDLRCVLENAERRDTFGIRMPGDETASPWTGQEPQRQEQLEAMESAMATSPPGFVPQPNNMLPPMIDLLSPTERAEILLQQPKSKNQFVRNVASLMQSVFDRDQNARITLFRVMRERVPQNEENLSTMYSIEDTLKCIPKDWRHRLSLVIAHSLEFSSMDEIFRLMKSEVENQCNVWIEAFTLATDLLCPHGVMILKNVLLPRVFEDSKASRCLCEELSTQAKHTPLTLFNKLRSPKQHSGRSMQSMPTNTSNLFGDNSVHIEGSMNTDNDTSSISSINSLTPTHSFDGNLINMHHGVSPYQKSTPPPVGRNGVRVRAPPSLSPFSAVNSQITDEVSPSYGRKKRVHPDTASVEESKYRMAAVQQANSWRTPGSFPPGLRDPTPQNNMNIHHSSPGIDRAPGSRGSNGAGVKKQRLHSTYVPIDPPPKPPTSSYSFSNVAAVNKQAKQPLPVRTPSPPEINPPVPTQVFENFLPHSSDCTAASVDATKQYVVRAAGDSTEEASALLEGNIEVTREVSSEKDHTEGVQDPHEIDEQSVGEETPQSEPNLFMSLETTSLHLNGGEISVENLIREAVLTFDTQVTSSQSDSWSDADEMCTSWNSLFEDPTDWDLLWTAGLAADELWAL